MEEENGARLAMLLLGTFEAMVARVRDELREQGHEGLTVAHEFAMRAIDGGAVNAAGLARDLGVSRQAAAKTIAALEGLDYVTRQADAADRRRKDLTLTSRGRAAIAIGSAAFDRIRDEWIAEVGSSGVDTVEVHLAALRDRLSRSGGL